VKTARPRKAIARSSARKPTKAAKPRLLSGGNPQIAKADGDAPVQAYLAAMPGWKSGVGRRLDALIARTVPGVRKAVKWNSPFYGVDGQGWFLNFHTFTNYIKVAFFRGKSLRPLPPGASKHKDVRYVDLREHDLDEAQMAAWVKQGRSAGLGALAIPCRLTRELVADRQRRRRCRKLELGRRSGPRCRRRGDRRRRRWHRRRDERRQPRWIQRHLGRRQLGEGIAAGGGGRDDQPAADDRPQPARSRPRGRDRGLGPRTLGGRGEDDQPGGAAARDLDVEVLDLGGPFLAAVG